MPKTKKTSKKTEEIEDFEEDEKDIKGTVKVEEEDLPDDVQEALGIRKQTKKGKTHEVDYIAELENDFEDTTFDDPLDGLE